MNSVIPEGSWANYGEVPTPYDVTGPDVPPSFARVIEEPRRYPPEFLTAPDGQYQALLKENIAWQEAPDPIRQSPFWDAGQKVNPDARQRITSHLGLNTWQSWEQGTYEIGKLLGYLQIKMFQGGQAPVGVRANVQPAIPTTYGSLYEVSPMVTNPGPAYTSTGFDLQGYDGYPY